MSWTDTSPPAGIVSYRIRRESVDNRYRWESPEAWWPPKIHRPLVLSRQGGSLLTLGRMELAGAEAGPLELRIYDIQGRLVLQRQSQPSGTGRDAFELGPGNGHPPLAAGIYFAVVRDSRGLTSEPLKLVLLR